MVQTPDRRMGVVYHTSLLPSKIRITFSIGSILPFGVLNKTKTSRQSFLINYMVAQSKAIQPKAVETRTTNAKCKSNHLCCETLFDELISNFSLRFTFGVKFFASKIHLTSFVSDLVRYTVHHHPLNHLTSIRLQALLLYDNVQRGDGLGI